MRKVIERTWNIPEMQRYLPGILLALGCVSATVAQPTLTPELAVGLKSVRSAALNPTGQRVAYVLSVPRSADDEPGGAYSEVWVADVESGNARRHTKPKSSARAPAWSPDGACITFLARRADENEYTQIYRLPVDGGEAELLTEHESSVSAYRWSHDGSFIAFSARDPKSDEEKEDEEAGRDWNVVDENLEHVRLWVMDVASGDSNPVYEGNLSTSSFAWVPDDAALVFQASKTPRTDDSMMYSGLYIVPRVGGEPRPICRTAGKLGRMAVSPDGSTLAYTGAVSLNDPSPQSVFVVDLPEGKPRNLTGDAELSASQVAWLDNGTLLMRATVDSRSSLTRVDVAGGQRTELAGARPVLWSFDLHAASGRLAAIGNTPNHPSELFVGSVAGAAMRRLTDSNPGLGALQLAEVEAVEWKARDGLRVAGVLTRPLEYEEGRSYPTIINPHGGPEAANRVGWNTFAQLLAARGYVVFQPNYRGSIGRGVAYSKGDHNDLGGKEFQDILDGLAFLVKRGITDPDRVGMGGWSYGGYMSALAATHHSRHFKAAVMGAGISNWMSFMGTTDIPHEMSIVHWNQWGYDDPAKYWASSPLSAIQNANTPTLILHGENDARVSPGQAWEMYTALKHKGVPVQMVLYPRSGHGVGERAHRLDLYKRQLDWFDRYVK